MISPIETSRAATLYLERINARMRTLFSATIVMEALGYEKEVYSIRFKRDGSVRAPDHLMPTTAEATEIANDIKAMRFPAQVTVAALSNSSLPDLILNSPEEKLFVFRKPNNGPIRFIQVRIELENGDKRYVPQTLWDDGEWRAIEPEEGLPIYGIDQVRRGDRVFLHEGAKASKAADAICKDISHPFHDFLKTGVHVGWIGGAHHLHRTLWHELQGLQPGEIVIFPDNDFIGRSKIRDIAGKFQCPVSFVKMDATWPKSWDVADPIPPSMFSEPNEFEVGGRYVGPAIEDMVTPCDWATEEIGQTENDRPIYGVREIFAQNWIRIQNLQHYAHLTNPEISYNKDQFNIAVRPFSDVIDTSAALARFAGNICDKVTFMPSMPTGIVRLDSEYCLNQYVDRRIKPIKSNAPDRAKPFWRFMEYMFPDPGERLVVNSWIATLYAKPERRMAFGMLFLSKLQGVGKSTMLNIMAELIGRKHASFPGDAMIQGDFNGWLVNKRLVVVHEIYAGQSWKTYNRLKTLITDEFVEANNKHIVNYTLPNWTHFAAASNSMEALRMEPDDRRWYVPGLPEYLYDGYDELRKWIRAGGLRYLAGELMDWEHFIKDGEQAPRTAAKSNLIDQSMPNDERMILVMMERMEPTVCVDVKELWLWLQKEANNRAFVSPQRISSLLGEHGFVVDPARTVGSRVRQVVWKSPEARAKVLKELTGDEEIKEVIASLRNPSEVFRSSADM